MKKHPLPFWLGGLLLIVLSLGLNLRSWLPVTEQSGTHYTLTLKAASGEQSYISLDFGKSHKFRIGRSPAFDELLEESALGKEYEIIADYRSNRRSTDYYEVYALSCTDGTVYLTLEQSESIRQGMLPRRLGLTLALDAIFCAVLFFQQKRRKAGSPSDNTDTEEESP